MSNILYYSNYCEPSKRLLQKLSKSKIREEIHFVCIDNRRKEPGNKIFIVLENGKTMLLPPTVTRVPALLLINRGYHVLFGNEIYRHLEPQEKVFMQKATNNNMEPLAFSITEMAGSSDAYSYLDTTPEDLMAKGDGGMRTMHNFVTLEQNDTIETPPEDYTPDKVEEGSLEKLQRERDQQVEKPIMRT